MGSWWLRRRRSGCAASALLTCLVDTSLYSMKQGMSRLFSTEKSTISRSCARRSKGAGMHSGLIRIRRSLSTPMRNGANNVCANFAGCLPLPSGMRVPPALREMRRVTREFFLRGTGWESSPYITRLRVALSCFPPKCVLCWPAAGSSRACRRIPWKLSLRSVQ